MKHVFDAGVAYFGAQSVEVLSDQQVGGCSGWRWSEVDTSVLEILSDKASDKALMVIGTGLITSELLRVTKE